MMQSTCSECNRIVLSSSCIALVLSLLSCTPAATAAPSAAPELSDVLSSKTLKAVMYTPLGPDGDACVRLLNATHSLGCASPTTEAFVEGPLFPVPDQFLDDDKGTQLPPKGAVAVVSAAHAGEFLRRAHDDVSLRDTLGGVLVMHSKTFPGWNSAQKTWPTPDNNSSSSAVEYAWNPAGKDLESLHYPFPIFQLDNTTSPNALQRSAANVGSDGTLKTSWPRHTARMELTMHAQFNASACIQQQTCLPLGGFSVVAALPPLTNSSLAPEPSLGATAVYPRAGSTADSNDAMVGTSRSRLKSDGVGERQTAASLAGSEETMPTVWVIASVDSSSLFHRMTQAANAPLSGLIAMLAAANALGAAQRKLLSHGSEWNGVKRRRLVFAALVGEPWGNMGSKRLLWEIEKGGHSVAGLNFSADAVAVIEIGQVGRAAKGAATSGEDKDMGAGENADSEPPRVFYAHSSSLGDATAELHAALKEAAASTSAAVTVNNASLDLPGLPPSSSRSFLKVRPDMPAVVLTEFDREFADDAFHSQYDTIDRLDRESVADAAELLARTLHVLSFPEYEYGAAGSATSEKSLPPLELNVSLREHVDALIECLVAVDPGLRCSLASSIMTPVNPGPVPHYIGVLRTIMEDSQIVDLTVQSDVERFIWNYLAFATATDNSTSLTDALNKPASHTANGSTISAVQSSSTDVLARCRPANASVACPGGTVCAGYRDIKGFEGAGVCLRATVRYVPSYSTSLECTGCNGTATWPLFGWNVTDQAQLLEWERRYNWPPDPMWTESNWPSGTPFLEMFLQDGPSAEAAAMAAGATATAASIVGVVATKMAWQRRLKRQ